MDRNTALKDTNLERSLNTLHVHLAGVLEKGKTITPDEVNGYLMDAIFSFAILAGWIDLPTTTLSPELQYILKPHARQPNPLATVTLGGFEVPESIHDDFISLFWHNQKRDWDAEFDAKLAETKAAWESDPDPFSGFRGGGDAALEQPMQAQSDTFNPAEVLVKGKTDLGVTWEKLRLKASRQLQSMAEEEAKEAKEQIEGRIVTLQIDSVFRLLRGHNISLDSAKAIAAAIGVDWKLLIWPTSAPKNRVQAKFK